MIGIKESELYYPLKIFLEQQDYEVYSEVKGKWFKKRADVVATKENKLVSFEMKTSLTFAVIDQARFWQRFSEEVTIVVPKTKTKRSHTALEVIGALGIGLIEIDMHNYNRAVSLNRPETWSNYLTVLIRPQKNSVTTRDKHMFDVLTEEHKTWSIGGSSAKDNSRYVTGYGLLMHDVYAYLRTQLDNEENDGWVTTKDIWEYLQANSKPNVVNHYRQPRPSISKSLLKYEQTDVESMKVGNRMYFKVMEESTKYLNMGENQE